MSKHKTQSPSRKDLEQQIEALRTILQESYLDMADLMDRARREGITDDDERVAWVNKLLADARVGRPRGQSPC